MADNFGLKIGLEGEKEFNKPMAEINSTYNDNGTEIKDLHSKFTKNDDTL